jgi:hypothetical protein
VPPVAVSVRLVWAQVSVVEGVADSVAVGEGFTVAVAVAVLVQLFTLLLTNTVKLCGPTDRPDTVVVLVWKPAPMMPLPPTKV